MSEVHYCTDPSNCTPGRCADNCPCLPEGVQPLPMAVLDAIRFGREQATEETRGPMELRYRPLDPGELLEAHAYTTRHGFLSYAYARRLEATVELARSALSLGRPVLLRAAAGRAADVEDIETALVYIDTALMERRQARPEAHRA